MKIPKPILAFILIFLLANAAGCARDKNTEPAPAAGLGMEGGANPAAASGADESAAYVDSPAAVESVAPIDSPAAVGSVAPINSPAAVENPVPFDSPAAVESASHGAEAAGTADSPVIRTRPDNGGHFVGADGETQYFYRFEGYDCVLYSESPGGGESPPKRLAAFPSAVFRTYDDGLAERPSVVCFGVCGDWAVVCVGDYEGSAMLFNGYFACVKKDGSDAVKLNLTDDDKFFIVGEWIYYNYFTFARTESPEGLRRVRPDGSENEYLGAAVYPVILCAGDGCFYGRHDTGETYFYGDRDTGVSYADGLPISDLVRCRPDGGDMVTLFRASALPKFDDSDRMGYENVVVTGDGVSFSVFVHGYKESDAYWGHVDYAADYRVGKDGEGLTLLNEEWPSGKP